VRLRFSIEGNMLLSCTPEVRDLLQLQAGFQAHKFVKARAPPRHHGPTLPPPQVRLLPQHI